MDSNNFGVNISGYINKQFGLGEGVRSNIRAIKTTDVPFVLNDFNLQISKLIADNNTEVISNDNPYNINLIQINIDRLSQVVEITDKKYFQNKYNIGFWAWELEEFPEESKMYFNLFNEIWVPSNFCTEAISKVSPIPVLKFMHSIEIENLTFTRQDFNLPQDKFIFLTMFDYYSSIERKNPLGTIDAFEKAFGVNNPDVLLVIKSSLSDEFPKEKRQILNRINLNSSVILIEEILERNKLYSLMNCCNSFVSLHRSEGFGLTMAEAMFLGKPVIATAYSGNVEFMNVNNSFLVKYNMIDCGDNYSFVSGTGFWADPDIDHASNLMKFVWENPVSTKEIAERGKQDVLKNLSPQILGEKIKKRLKFINDELLLKVGQSSSNNEALLVIENKLLEEKLNKLKGYGSIKIKLFVKNLKNKITGKDRKYMWE